MHFPTILDLGPAAVCVLAWIGAGTLVPRRLLAGEGLLLETLTRIGAGTAVLSLATFLLGLAGAFDRDVLVAITGALAVPGAVSAYRLIRRIRPLPVKRDAVTALVVVIGVALLLDVVASAAPPTSADALKYHLGSPKWWLANGRIDSPFWDWHSFSPFGIEMLYAHGLALQGGETAGVLGAALAILCALVVYGLGRELANGSSAAGAAAAALFVAQGIVTWEATSSFVELGLTFYAALGGWWALRFVRRRLALQAGWAGVFAGAAAGTKYVGIVASGVVLGLLGLACLRPVRLRPLCAALAPAALVPLAWYVRNWVVAGNPVYPLYFGGRWWTSGDERNFHATQDVYGIGGTVLKLPLLPVELLLHGNAFDRGQYVGTALFVLVPLAFFVRDRRIALAILAGVVVYLVAWWHLTQQARFLLPAAAALAAVGGAGAAAAIARVPPLRWPVAAVFVAAAVVWAISSVALTRQLLPVTVGAESRPHFLQRLTGTFATFVAVHRIAGDSLGLAMYTFPFNYPGRAIQLEDPAFAPWIGRAGWLRRVAPLRVDYVLAPASSSPLPELVPVAGCLRRLARYHARYVTSRSLGTSRPYDMVLYGVAPCRVPTP